MIGWIVAGFVVGMIIGAIDRFWNDIAGWLNNTAANAVEKVLGYDAKRFMHKAVATVTKLHDKLHNSSVIYTRQSALDTHIHKVTIKSVAPVYEQEEEVRELFEKENRQIKEFEYKN